MISAYAINFPNFKDFWSGLANEEKQHSKWVKQLRDLVISGKADFHSGSFNIFAVQALINNLNNELKMVSQHQRSILNALAVSQYIEESIIESKYFEVIKSDAAEIKNILNSLSDATKLNTNRVKHTLDNYKKTLN